MPERQADTVVHVPACNCVGDEANFVAGRHMVDPHVGLVRLGLVLAAGGPRLCPRQLRTRISVLGVWQDYGFLPWSSHHPPRGRKHVEHVCLLGMIRRHIWPRDCVHG